MKTKQWQVFFFFFYMKDNLKLAPLEDITSPVIACSACLKAGQKDCVERFPKNYWEPEQYTATSPLSSCQAKIIERASDDNLVPLLRRGPYIGPKKPSPSWSEGICKTCCCKLNRKLDEPFFKYSPILHYSKFSFLTSCMVTTSCCLAPACFHVAKFAAPIVVALL